MGGRRDVLMDLEWPQDGIATRETDAKSEMSSLPENSEFDVCYMR